MVPFGHYSQAGGGGSRGRSIPRAPWYVRSHAPPSTHFFTAKDVIMPDDPRPAAETSDITDLIQRIDDGTLYANLQDDLTALVAALRRHVALGNKDAKARLGLVLEFRFDGKLVEVLPTTSLKLPRPANGKGVFWTTKDNRLSPQNPAQLELGGVRDVSTDPAKPRHLQKA